MIVNEDRPWWDGGDAWPGCHRAGRYPSIRSRPVSTWRVDNLGPLSRTVHRARTHSGFSLRQPVPGLWIWRTPWAGCIRCPIAARSAGPDSAAPSRSSCCASGPHPTRSSARNIASVPCRCGHSWTKRCPPHGSGRAQSGTSGRYDGASRTSTRIPRIALLSGPSASP
ncbi:hypothetical protein SDC9_84862 [bioreactor metagenome]|uniref:Uncharacterized protein n=1 Tax=bioreactor metagenome TaxID=1076179 RepID=A0A644ZHR4_9ZZZZ